IQDHNHDNLSSDEHSKEHSHEKMGNQKDLHYFQKEDADLIKINHLEHHFHDIVITKTHIHIEHDKCVLIIPVKGSVKRIQEFYKELNSLKSVLSYHLVYCD
ncbi:MAG: hypothetical protein ACTSWY_06685, partial [Promethearchaeota archaeon]